MVDKIERTTDGDAVATSGAGPRLTKTGTIASTLANPAEKAAIKSSMRVARSVIEDCPSRERSEQAAMPEAIIS